MRAQNMLIFIINIMDSRPIASYKIKGKGTDKRKKMTRKIQCLKSLQSHLPNTVLRNCSSLQTQ